MSRIKKRKGKKKKKLKRRNMLLVAILKEDNRRLHTRTVKSEKGKGRKNRPRKKNWTNEE